MVLYEELFEASLCRQSDKWTKDTLSGLPTCKGVLLFANINQQPIQLLQTANLRRITQARLLRDDINSPSRKTDVSELTNEVFFTGCYNSFESQLLFIRMGHAIFKSSDRHWIQLPKPLFAVIDLNADLPYFYASGNPKNDSNRHVFGLFPNRKAAGLFCEALNTVFCLCRNPSLLKTGKEKSCPYMQMQTCLGPCLDQSCTSGYFNKVRQATAAAAGMISAAIESLKSQMMQASTAKQFEMAGTLKKQITNLCKLTSPDFYWVNDLDKLNILAVDVGPKRKIRNKNNKRQLYKAWRINAGSVYELGTFAPRTALQIKSFLTQTWDKGREIIYASKNTEHLAAISLLLFRSGRAGLWLDYSDGKFPAELFDELLDK